MGGWMGQDHRVQYGAKCGKNRYVTHPLSWLTSAHKVTWLFDRVVLRDHMKNKNHYISITTVSMATELGRVLTNLERLLLIILRNRLKSFIKTIISPLHDAMITKHSRTVIYHEGVPPIRPHDPLLMQFWNITWQTKINLFPRCLGPQNLAEWWLILWVTLQQRDLARSCDKLKSLYIHYHNAYDYQTWQDGYIHCRASLHKVTRHFDHVVLQVIWNIRYVISQLPSDLWLTKLARWRPTMRIFHP